MPQYGCCYPPADEWLAPLDINLFYSSRAGKIILLVEAVRRAED